MGIHNAVKKVIGKGKKGHGMGRTKGVSSKRRGGLVWMDMGLDTGEGWGGDWRKEIKSEAFGRGGWVTWLSHLPGVQELNNR